MGRHSSFTQEVADAICERLADGESMRSICRDDDMPDTKTVLRWLSQNESFRTQYAHARELQADALADQILDISNTPVIGETTTTKEFGESSLTEIKRADMIEHRRLQIDARKWYAGKLRPKVYGNHIEPENNDATLSDAVNKLIDKLPG